MYTNFSSRPLCSAQHQRLTIESISRILLFNYPSRKHPTHPSECLPLPYSIPPYRPNTIPPIPNGPTPPEGPFRWDHYHPASPKTPVMRAFMSSKTLNCNKTFRYAGFKKLKKGGREREKKPKPILPMLSAKALCLKVDRPLKWLKRIRGLRTNDVMDVQERSGKGTEHGVHLPWLSPFL